MPLPGVKPCLQAIELVTSEVAVRNRVAMPVDDLPVPILSSEAGRDPQLVGDRRRAAHGNRGVLDANDVGK